MYEEGAPASKCPLNPKKDTEYPNLCKANDARGPLEKNTTDTGILWYCDFPDEKTTFRRCRV